LNQLDILSLKLNLVKVLRFVGFDSLHSLLFWIFLLFFLIKTGRERTAAFSFLRENVFLSPCLLSRVNTQELGRSRKSFPNS